MLLKFRRANQEAAKYLTPDRTDQKKEECQRLEQLYEEIVRCV